MIRALVALGFSLKGKSKDGNELNYILETHEQRLETFLVDYQESCSKSQSSLLGAQRTNSESMNIFPDGQIFFCFVHRALF